MSRRLVALILLSACVLAYRGAALWQLASGTGPVLGLGSLSLRDGRLVALSVPRTNFEGETTPGWAAGLRPGDAILAIETPRGGRFEIVSLKAYGAASRSLQQGDRWTLEVERIRQSRSERLRLQVSPAKPSALVLATGVFVTGVLPLLAVSTTLLIGFLRPDSGAAFLAGLLFLSFSAFFGANLWTLPDGFREVATAVHTSLATLFGYLFLRFFLVFPSPSRLDALAPWLKHVLAVPTALIAAGSIALTLTATYSIAAADRLNRVLGGSLVESVLAQGLTAMVVLGLVSGAWQVASARTLGDRRRLAILIGGATIGLLPFLSVVMYLVATGTENLAIWMIPVVLLTLPLFPLSFMYAVVRHRVLGVGVIIRRGVQHALVSRGVLLTEGLLVFFALYLGVGPFLSRALPEAGVGSIATTNALAALVVVAGLGQINRRMKAVIDRRFFREPYNAQQVLADLGAALQASAADPERLARALARSLASSLHAGFVAVHLDRRLLRLRAAAGGEADTRADGAWPCAAQIRVDPETGQEMPGDGPEPGPPLAPSVVMDLLATQADSGGIVELDAPTDWRGVARQVAGSARPGGGSRPAWDRLAGRGVRAVGALRVRETLLGWVLLGDKLSEDAYTREDRALVRAAIQQTAVALDYTTLIARVAEQEAMKRELDIARQVQAGLLPQTRPPIESLDYDGTCRMAREVGGDYFDFVDVGQGHLAIAVGDISGKGVSAALLMASLQALLRSRARQVRDDPARLVTEVNAAIVESTDHSKFATFFYAIYDGASRELAYVNAGHNPPLLLRATAGTPVRLEPTGMALGFDTHAAYEARRDTLRPGDLLLVYTDGLTEALNPDGEEFGEARLAEAFVGHRDQAAAELQGAILDAVAAFCGGAPPHDDLTVVVARVR